MLNKIDLRPEPPRFGVDDERIVRVFRVSAATGAGIDELRSARSSSSSRAAPSDTPAPEEQELVDYLVYRPQPLERAYRVFRTDRGFRVTGRPPDGQELEAILKAAGAREGDEVEIGEETLEWQ